LGYVLLLIAAAVLVLSIVLSPIVEGGVALPFAVRVLITIALISPVGFAMGTPFPTGLSLLERIMPASVRWAWAINAASSVMGSAAAMFLAIYLGLQTTLIIGGLFYLGAWFTVKTSLLARDRSAELLAA
jgi:hypothetical protein